MIRGLAEAGRLARCSLWRGYREFDHQARKPCDSIAKVTPFFEYAR